MLPLLLLLAYGLFIFTPLIADPDLWGHVRFGQDTLRTGQIVRADPYSYLSAGGPWMNHEWLSEVIQAAAYNAAGAGGIIALNLGPALVTVALLYARLVRRGMGAWGAALVMAGYAWALRPGVLNARPQVWTYLMLALLALTLEGVENARTRADGDERGGETQGGDNPAPTDSGDFGGVGEFAWWGAGGSGGVGVVGGGAVG